MSEPGVGWIAVTLGGADAERLAVEEAARIGGAVVRADDDHDRPRYHVVQFPSTDEPPLQALPEERLAVLRDPAPEWDDGLGRLGGSDHALSDTEHAEKRRTQADRRVARSALHVAGGNRAAAAARLRIQAEAARFGAKRKRDRGLPADSLDQRADRRERAAALLDRGAV